MDRRRFLAGGLHLGAFAAAAPLLKGQDFSNGPAGSLKSVASSCGMSIGVQAERQTLSTNAAFAQMVKSNFNLITPGNELKWPRLRPTPDSFNFTDGDWMVDFAQASGMRVQGTTLCWNAKYNPGWFDTVLNKDNAKQYLTQHIATVMKHYSGKIDSWVVVNEPFVPWGKQGGFYPGVWLNLLGTQYIDIAFHAAADADPKALRIINLHHVENEIPDDEKTRQLALQNLKQMVGRGVPIQAVGLESHIDTALPTAGPGLIRFIKEVQDLGLQTLITELDVNDAKVPGDPNLMDQTDAQYYYDYITRVVPAGRMNMVIFWTPSDKYNWMNSVKGNAQYQRADNLKHRGGLLDENIAPKSAYRSVASALQKVCSRS